MRKLGLRESSEVCEKLWKCESLIYVQLFVIPWIVAYQAPLSMGFSSKNTRVGCHSLLQGDLPDPGTGPVSSIAGGFFTIWSPLSLHPYLKTGIETLTFNPQFLKFIFNWSIITLHYCDSFCCITKWVSYKHTYMLLPLHPTPSGHHRAPLALSWAPGARPASHQLSIYTWSCRYINTLL